MKINSKFATVIMLGLVALPIFGLVDTPEQHEVDKIVAIVNDDVITRSALEKEITAFTKTLKHDNKQLPPQQLMEEKLLERLVYKSIQTQIARRANITVTDQELDKAITKIADRNNLTLEQFKFALSRDGMDFKVYKEDLKNQLIINKIQTQALQNKIKISDEEIDKLLKAENEKGHANLEYHIKHLLVKVSDKPTPEEWQTAKQKALKYSTKEAKSKSKEIAFEDFGWKKASELPGLFTAQLASMKKNEISVPLRAPNGFHIIMLVDSKNKNTEMTREDASNILYHQKFEKELMDWLEKMKKSSYVKTMI